jgi:hypothetical protein
VIGWFPAYATPELQPRNVAQISVIRRDGKYILQNGTTTAFHAATVDAAVEAVIELMRNERLRGNALALDLRGEFGGHEATAFVETCQIRAHANGSRRVMSAHVDDGKLPEATLRELRSLGLDLSKAIITPKDLRSTGAAIETGFTVEIPTVSRDSALLDVDLAFDKSIGRTNVRAVMGRILGWVRAFAAEPRATIDLWLLNHSVNQAIKRISTEQGVRVHVIGHKFRHRQHDVHFTQLQHEQPHGIGLGRPA